MSKNLLELPEGCLSHILSLSSPIDVLRSSTVSKQFLSASESDTVWEKFLPSGYDDIITQSSSPIEFNSKKDLILHLCRSHLLFNNSTMSCALNIWSGKKCYMLGARALEIIWGSTPHYWTWKSVPESRFPEVAKLLSVCWLDIKGKIHTKLLSPSTTYGAYFVFKVKDVNISSGFEYMPVKVHVSETHEEDGLPRHDDHNHNHVVVIKSFYLKAPESEERDFRREPGELPIERSDGWMEIEIGIYQVGVHDAANERLVLEMSLREVDVLGWKQGLIVQGIELRPLD